MKDWAPYLAVTAINMSIVACIAWLAWLVWHGATEWLLVLMFMMMFCMAEYEKDGRGPKQAKNVEQGKEAE